MHATDLTTLQCLPRALLAVNEDGAIDWIIDDVDPASLQEAALTKGWSLDDVDFVELSEGEFLCPGFVDTHTVRTFRFSRKQCNVELIWRGRELACTAVPEYGHVSRVSSPRLGWRLMTIVVCRGQQYELLDWLANVTFPTEARFADVEYAKKAYNSVVQRVLNCGVSLGVLW